MNKILLFIPAYNCENQITKVLNQLDEEVMRFISQIIVVSNISTDNTEKIIENYMSKSTLPIILLRNDYNYGLGGSHKVAFEYARNNSFDYIVVLHGDNQGKIKDLVPYIKNGKFKRYDCVLGARFMKKSKLINYSRFRTFGNKVFNFIFSLFLSKRIYDLGSGLNIYSVEMLKDNFYFEFPDNLTFNYCMIMAAKYYKHDIRFVPISWSEEDQVSNVKIISQAAKVLKMLFTFTFDNEYIKSDLREKKITSYTSKVVKSNVS